MAAPEADETLESYGSDIGRRTNSWTRLQEWVLVDGDRLVVAALISLGVFVGSVLLNEVGIISFVNDDSLTRTASGLIAGTFSLVTLVVSINQLILSQEFAPAGDARSQIENVLSFRADVAEAADVPASPASPARLIELLAESIQTNARELTDAAEMPDDEEQAELLDQFAQSLSESSDRLDETLEQSKLDAFTALSAAIRYDAPWHLYVARQLRGRHSDSLSDEAVEELDSLIEDLTLFATAREHYKTTYLQRELTRFSQLTIYTGVPAILSSILIGLIYADFAGPSLTVAYLPYVVSALIAVIVTPLALLTSYILRTATVTRRTVSTGPMIPQKDPDAGPFSTTVDDKSE
ncbi:uncharacterized protein Nmag_2281 [Natrialba magadii ATCC 43099]|uniref:Uncharacterized protein n=1 Tax=Natrialba magadii (strain ATCC 43099 / DSM 3394 / CCM 3739 / CIP 104546 / IAM 13178 / JCM 8861 / NBRC 102185 / NCIMB 2190 / MS3) TaxID=547559 RepID=D3SWW4_NATMM|nr:hypothetical protein [Natrialba magadii]ADD05846.1 uncharacterized protein Nmag_2281 [Natrialba magadii ATCC 43099]ELY30647.1 hypothetical protein C500_09007 [Natrialba magadii ATCC 43099]